MKIKPLTEQTAGCLLSFQPEQIIIIDSYSGNLRFRGWGEEMENGTFRYPRNPIHVEIDPNITLAESIMHSRYWFNEPMDVDLNVADMYACIGDGIMIQAPQQELINLVMYLGPVLSGVLYLIIERTTCL